VLLSEKEKIMAKKILIFSGSPQRDKLIDELLAEKLRGLGNEVFVRKIPIGAQKAILEIKPNIVIVPPIRNPFAQELCVHLGKWNVGVVIRHVEPSCDTSDLESMAEGWARILLIPRPTSVRLELFWSQTELDFVKGRSPTQHPMAPVGALVADIYKDARFEKRFTDREKFNQRYKFKKDKTLLISSPWGLIDLDSDNLGQTFSIVKKDAAAKGKWVKMVRCLYEQLSSEWNILITLHPGLDVKSYESELSDLDLMIDCKSSAPELMMNCDALVHSGSTLAVEMHWLNKPAFQFGDVNSIDLPDGNWWHQAEASISRVSPFYLDGESLADAVIKCDLGKTNANLEIKSHGKSRRLDK
jgi:hypothetical protein